MTDPQIQTSTNATDSDTKKKTEPKDGLGARPRTVTSDIDGDSSGDCDTPNSSVACAADHPAGP